MTPTDRRTVEFKGEKYTPKGARLEMRAVLAGAKRDLQDVLNALPDLPEIGRPADVHLLIALTDLSTVINEFDYIEVGS